MFFDVFLSISAHISLVLFFQGSAEAHIGWGGILNYHLMASCARNNRTESYYNWLSLLQVTIDNVRDVFFRTRFI